VPADLDELRVLIIMGGPMGVSDVTNASYPSSCRRKSIS